MRDTPPSGSRLDAEELEGFFSVNLDLLCIANLDGYFLKVNQAWCRTLGYTTEELCRRRFLELIHPDDLQPTLDALASLGSGEDVFDFTNRYRCTDGSYRHLHWRSHPHGNLIYAAARDVTDQMRNEEALRTSEANFRTFFEAMEDMVVVANPMGRILFANNALIANLGYGLEDLESLDVLDLHPPDRRAEAAGILAAMSRGELETCPLPLQRRDGTLVPVETRVSFGRWNGQDCFFGIIKDVTKEQEALQKFDKLFDLNPSMMALSLLPERRFVEVNQAFLTELGYRREDVVGKTAMEVGLFADPDAMRASGLVMEREGRIRDFETHLRTADGSTRTGLLSGEVIEIGGQRFILGVMVDITARKRAEAALQYEKDLFSAGPVFTIERGVGEGTPILTVSSNVEQVLGYPPTELVSPGFVYDSLIHPDDAARIASEMARHIESRVDTFEQSLRLKTRSGEYRWFHDFTMLVRDQRGELAGIRGYLYDQTVQKTAELQLATERARLAGIIEGTHVGTWEWNVQTGETVFNERWAEIIGRTLEEISPVSIETWVKYAHPDDLQRSGELLRKHFAGELDYYEFESRMLHRNGEWVWVLDRGRVTSWTPDGKPLLMLGTHQEITERKRAEEQLRAAKLQAEAASKAKSEFLANMSHEIRTPLNGVIGFTDLLRKTPLAPLQQQYVDNANASGRALLDIVNDILDFSKIEAGMMEMEVVRTDMIELLGSCVDIVQYSAGRKNLEVLLDIDRSLPRFAMVDPIRLRQILANLLGNAVKFTERGEVELKVVHEPLEGGWSRLRIAVRDTGIGISEAQKEKLFKAFSQADSSTTRKFGGTGLGLIISDMIATRMGSKIHLESTPGKGSTFHFELLLETEPGEEADPTALGNLRRCLVIEDNDNNRRILTGMLESWGIQVATCDNGLSALKVLETSEPFDAIVCDYDMPYLDGLETARLIRKGPNPATRDLPIVLLHSSSDDTGLHRRCDGLGIPFRLGKPVKSDDLFSSLREIRDPSSRSGTDAAGDGTSPGASPLPPREFRILVVEDVEMNMLLISHVIGMMAPESTIYEATNGHAAVDAFRKERPDLILMDVQMPGMDGLEATRAIRALETDLGGHVPIIALTAGAFKMEQERCVAAGMDGFLTKPLDPEKLKAALDGIRQPAA